MQIKESFKKPHSLLSPAGDRESFLAALAAGADGIYCGLKAFSARMEADNFSMAELYSLTRLAHEKKARVHVALNSLVKPDELEKVFHLVLRLCLEVKPDVLIVQDLALVSLAREAGFEGELHLSTLGNLSFPEGLGIAKHLGFSQVVMPRELSVDELRSMAEACPEGLFLEVFIHGALCYSVSGRCYWSSYLGGKSALRGRCVQPCRRLYAGERGPGGRAFSMKDLSLDILIKLLSEIPEVQCMKIEGRKKGPHYVYYTTSAYRMLRDEREQEGTKKTALAFLDLALGRPAMHYRFLPQRPWNPLAPDSEMASGLLVGRVKGGKAPFLVPRLPLMAGDLLRMGYEGEGGHSIIRVKRAVPKGGKFVLAAGDSKAAKQGMAVFLVDRREPALMESLLGLEEDLKKYPPSDPKPVKALLRLPQAFSDPGKSRELFLFRRPGKLSGKKGNLGLWLEPGRENAVGDGLCAKLSWWLDPVIWPEDSAKWQKAISGLLKRGARRFVLNAPWQIAFFENFEKRNELELWAGPFCNIANALAAEVLKDMGFSGVFVSPELGEEDLIRFAKESPLPSGILLSGFWPLGLSRVPVLGDGESLTSPKGERLWGRNYGGNQWLFPDWPLDIREKKDQLEKAGYKVFVHLDEPLPKGMNLKERPGLWNWKLRLL
ncbi:U32 family peptidase [Desulfococcaceae bacterium OttesenSCG-928-F15]|nr:U32 family peptidase [Desulfococcaceae bacterium OttesenSCG-928-F15]